MELDKQPPQHLQVDQPSISSQETMSNNIEDGTSNENQLPKSLIPTIGMEFASVEEAYYFYNDYALQVGFSVRKNLDKKNKSNVVTMKCFTCNREDKSRERSPTKAPPKFKRPDLRIGCNAHMKIKICSNGAYKVTSFELDHNHATSTPTKAKMLKSHRSISKAQKTLGYLADVAGIKPKETYDLLAKQAGGRHNLTFIPHDYKNYLRTKREHDITLGDAGALLQYLQDCQNEDPSFYYAIQDRIEVHVTERYSFLAGSYNDVFSIAAHSTKAYRYALGMVREVMSKVEELALEERYGA